jgi:glyoxylase-like metal-dependent hydrolase (beta-lactamase superfamily II)
MRRIVRVLAPNPSVYTLEGTNTWVVGEDPAVVIDPGPSPEEVPGHQDEVLAEARGRVGAVLVTHDHPDHAPGARSFAERAGAPLMAWRLDGAERLRDGQELRVGSTLVRAVHTPGHTGDHVAFWLSDDRALFTGDAVLGRGTSFIDPPEGDLVQYLRGLERMAELAPRTIYPGHGPIVLRAPEKLREYLEHRAERERQILAALADEPRSIAGIVAIVYAAYPMEVHELAGRSVLAHLKKLEAEGRVQRRGRGRSATYALAAPRDCARCGKPVRGPGRYCASCSLLLLQEAGPEPSAALEERPSAVGEVRPGPASDGEGPRTR